MLVHSFIYYELDDSLITDSTYDEWSLDLVRLREAHPEAYKESAYAEEFKTFDGSTGMDLPYRLPWIEAVVSRLMKRGRIEASGKKS